MAKKKVTEKASPTKIEKGGETTKGTKAGLRPSRPSRPKRPKRPGTKSTD